MSLLGFLDVAASRVTATLCVLICFARCSARHLYVGATRVAMSVHCLCPPVCATSAVTVSCPPMCAQESWLWATHHNPRTGASFAGEETEAGQHSWEDPRLWSARLYEGGPLVLEVTETHFRFAQEKLGRDWLSPVLTAQPRPASGTAGSRAPGSDGHGQGTASVMGMLRSCDCP